MIELIHFQTNIVKKKQKKRQYSITELYHNNGLISLESRMDHRP